MDANIVDKLNKACPALKRAKLGDLLDSALYIQKVTISEDATSGIDFTVEIPGELIFAWVVCTATNASGTLTVERDTTAITDAIACDTVDTVTVAGTISQDNKTLTKGETLNVVSAGSADEGIVYLAILRS